MEILLIANWEEKFKASNAMIYLLGPKDQEIVDMEFDRLHKQGRMEWNGSTPFTFPCFVV